MHLLPADIEVEPLVASVHERGELVDREEVLDAVAELLGHVPGEVGERLGGSFDCQPPCVLERLRQVPVVERHEGLDAGGEQLVDEAAVEVEPFGFGGPVPSGKIRGQAIENRYAVAPMDFISATSSL